MNHGSSGNYQRLFSEHSPISANTKAKIRDLEARVDKLELICESLWEFIKEDKKLKEVDLIERMTQIDLQDGVYDHKKKKSSSIKCTKCKRMNSKRHSKCMYCGQVFIVGPFD